MTRTYESDGIKFRYKFIYGGSLSVSDVAWISAVVVNKATAIKRR